MKSWGYTQMSVDKNEKSVVKQVLNNAFKVEEKPN